MTEAEQERERIVAWLLRWADHIDALPQNEGALGPMLDAVNAALTRTARRQARAIERGDHLGELKPCARCGSPCTKQTFGPSKHIEGEMTVYLCSNSPALGGSCSDTEGSLTVEAWNTRVNEARPDRALVGELEAALAIVTRDGRLLPWVVQSGCSFRRIATKPTIENGCHGGDGNVLAPYRQTSDGHPDLTMGERELEALCSIINSLPRILTALRGNDAEE